VFFYIQGQPIQLSFLQLKSPISAWLKLLTLKVSL
jgi:hypothetical protein